MVAGSSPLARGLLRPLGVDCERMGIIPARAGFTVGYLQRYASVSDHPRSRGVYDTGNDEGDSLWGSSPLARGLRKVVVNERTLDGIIPARAGFTQLDVWQTYMHQGSSPLARGLLVMHRWGNYARRIIPARAGFTILTMNCKFVPADHPRSRGVYSIRG